MKTFKIIPSCTMPYSPSGQVGEPLCEVGVFNMEIWKPIKNYEGRYEVSNLGRIKALEKLGQMPRGNTLRKYPEKIMATYISDMGYATLCLFTNSKGQTKYVHRLVAETFLPNYKNKSQVNHKNGIKTDNRVDNLEWVTPSENVQHAFKTGLHKVYSGKDHHTSKPLRQLTLEGKLIKIWDSCTQVKEQLGINHSGLCCQGITKTAGGFKWEWI